VQVFSDGLELGHNQIVGYSQNILGIVQGLQDVASSIGNRIGDKISMQSVQIKGMVELNERYSNVGITVMVLASAKGDNPSAIMLICY